MPRAIPGAGLDGLPPISTRAFQLIDEGATVFDAFWRAVQEWADALVRFLGAEITADIGEIG